jgi:hypothetical protein
LVLNKVRKNCKGRGIYMSEIDYTDLHFVDEFVYEITPDKNGDMVLIFKVNDVSCAMPIQKKDLKRLLGYTEMQ